MSVANEILVKLQTNIPELQALSLLRHSKNQILFVNFTDLTKGDREGTFFYFLLSLTSSSIQMFTTKPLSPV